MNISELRNLFEEVCSNMEKPLNFTQDVSNSPDGNYYQNTETNRLFSFFCAGFNVGFRDRHETSKK